MADAGDFDPLEGLLCLWAWDGVGKAWGLSATVPDTGRGCCDHWLYATPEPGGDADPEPVPGRMVTGWSVGRGVSLVEMHPPGPTGVLRAWPLAELFGSDPDVWPLLDGGPSVYLGTIDAVKRAFAAWKGAT